MNALGTPILGDDLYPDVLQQVPGDFSRPLQLLAESIAFTDPVTGRPRRFATRRALQQWPPGRQWGTGRQRNTGRDQGGNQGHP